MPMLTDHSKEKCQGYVIVTCEPETYILVPEGAQQVGATSREFMIKAENKNQSRIISS